MYMFRWQECQANKSLHWRQIARRSGRSTRGRYCERVDYLRGRRLQILDGEPVARYSRLVTGEVAIDDVGDELQILAHAVLVRCAAGALGEGGPPAGNVTGFATPLRVTWSLAKFCAGEGIHGGLISPEASPSK